jgi:hypothetical protein
MKNNKVLMSLVAASIAAMAAAPELLKSDAPKTEDQNSEHKIIDLAAKAPKQLTDEQAALSEDAKNQVGAMLNKKAPVMKVSESVSVLVDNYGSNDESVKEKIYRDLKLTQVTPNQDSTTAPTTIFNPGATGMMTGPSTVLCHSACHGACHAACHGSRGWR